MPDPKPRLIHEYHPTLENAPTTAEEGVRILEDGNSRIVAFREDCNSSQPRDEPPVVALSARQLGLDIPADDLGFPKQAPWAVFLGCSDARVPSEMLFGQGFNDVFGIRVAGNVLGESEEGSLAYALDHFTEDLSHLRLPKLVLVVVLGHRGCGAVKAVVDHYQSFGGKLTVEEAMAQLGCGALDGLMRRIYRPALIEAVAAFDEPWSTSVRARLVDETVARNAELTARSIARMLPKGGGVRAAFGVYDPDTFRVTAERFTILEKRRREGLDVEPRSRLELVEA